MQLSRPSHSHWTTPTIQVETKPSEQTIAPDESHVTSIEISQAPNSIIMSAVAAVTDDLPPPAPMTDVIAPSLSATTPQAEDTHLGAQSFPASSSLVIVAANEDKMMSGVELVFSSSGVSNFAPPAAGKSQELGAIPQPSIELTAPRQLLAFQQHQLEQDAIFDEFGFDPQESALLSPQAVSLLRSSWL